MWSGFPHDQGKRLHLIISTTEMVARFIWEQLVDLIPAPAKLVEVRLWETEKNAVIYQG